MDELELGCAEGTAGAKEIAKNVQSRVARFALDMAAQSLNDARAYINRAHFIVQNGDHVEATPGLVVDLATSAFLPACTPNTGKKC